MLNIKVGISSKEWCSIISWGSANIQVMLDSIIHSLYVEHNIHKGSYTKQHAPYLNQDMIFEKGWVQHYQWTTMPASQLTVFGITCQISYGAQVGSNQTEQLSHGLLAYTFEHQVCFLNMIRTIQLGSFKRPLVVSIFFTIHTCDHTKTTNTAHR